MYLNRRVFVMQVIFPHVLRMLHDKLVKREAMHGISARSFLAAFRLLHPKLGYGNFTIV